MTETKTVPAPVVEDDRTRAARRTAELIDLYGENNVGEGEDKFWIDPNIIPDGWTYEWKRYTTLGAQDPAYQVSLARGGWESVPASRHPEFMPIGWKSNVIEREGLVLMERPNQIHEIVQMREKRKAGELVGDKEQQLRSGPDTPFNNKTRANYLRKTREAIEIPKI